MVSGPGAGFGAGNVLGGYGRIRAEPIDEAVRSLATYGRVPVLAGISESVTRMALAGVVLLVLGLAGVAVWRSGLSSLLSEADRDDAADGSAASSTPETPPEPTPSTPEQTATTEAESTAREEVAGERTDREIVVDILDEHDGRMKQALIVDETGWSKSKVSMLLSEMEDDGDISKLRVGRENIISLSGNEPEAAGSPFEDE